MTPDLYACVGRSFAAERAGDVAAALEWHQSVPMFRRGRNRWMLDQLAHLGDGLPEWVWARWIAYQVTRCSDGVTGRLVSDRRHEVIDTLHCELLEDCFRQEGDPIQVAARVTGESWAFHQLACHEGGGLAAFIDEFATARLREHADLARRWAGTRMSGFELGESLPGARLRVRDVNGGEWLDVLDLGARSCAPGGWVLGRLVPAGTGDVMFDMPPLAVAKAVARAVAEDPGGDWFGVVVHALQGGLVSSDTFLRKDYQLTGDVQDLELVRFGTKRRELGRVMQERREGRDEVSPAAYRILDRTRRGEVDPADQAYVAAAALNTRAYRDARRDTVRSGETAVWLAWQDRVAEPARGRLLALAGIRQPAA